MAEPDYSSPSWGSVSSRPGMRASDMSAPLLSAHSLPFPPPFQQLPYEASYGPLVNPPLPQFPAGLNGPFGNQTPGRSPYPLDGRHPLYYPTPPRTFPYMPTQPRPPPAFRNAPMNQGSESGGLPDPNEWHPRTDNSLFHHTPFFPPAYGQNYEAPVSPPQASAPTARRQHYSMMGATPPPRYFGQEPVRAPHGGVPDQPRQFTSPPRRAPHPDPYQLPGRPHDNAERRSSMPFTTQGRRSDRSVSPRTSNRRSFDRYSFDLSQASTSSDAEEAAARAPPSNRIRHRPREVRPRFMGHHAHHQHLDPNIATPRQIQDLKERLPRRLPSSLPDDSSKGCDICQKDYASTHVPPTEEDEIAVELPCGHIFGEFCLFQWFDTCKTHKNKVTCPMCRKLLIEPPRYHPALLSAISRGGPAFQELLANELRGDFSHM